MELRKILEKQIELLDEINESLKEVDPEQVRKNIETIIELVTTLESIIP